MKDFKLYTYTSIIFVLLFGLLSLFTIPLIVKQYSSLLLDNVYSSMKREAATLSLIHKNTTSKDEFLTIAQKVLEGTQENNFFISIIDWTGNYICYPDITQVGERVVENKEIEFEGEINGKKLYSHFFNYFNSIEQIETKIIELEPINGSDLILIYNLNLKEISNAVKQIKEQTYLIFVILGLLLLIVFLIVIRLLSINSNKILEQKILNLEYNTKSIAKLNESITLYQQRLEQQNEKKVEEPDGVEQGEGSKQRILTYIRNELVSILITDIAYIYVDNTITYIIRKNGKKATSNDSLDKIYSILDKEIFFKTNRQFIVAITAIEKITKFGNSKLKIEVKPKSEIDIIIGKNKASSFKQWLDL